MGLWLSDCAVVMIMLCVHVQVGVHVQAGVHVRKYVSVRKLWLVAFRKPTLCSKIQKEVLKNAQTSKNASTQVTQRQFLLLSSPFSLSMDSFKNTPKIFLNCWIVRKQTTWFKINPRAKEIPWAPMGIWNFCVWTTGLSIYALPDQIFLSYWIIGVLIIGPVNEENNLTFSYWIQIKLLDYWKSEFLKNYWLPTSGHLPKIEIYCMEFRISCCFLSSHFLDWKWSNCLIEVYKYAITFLKHLCKTSK
jgi:hypothetical protein